MNLETLSDNQLIALFKNSKLDKERPLINGQ